MNLKTVYHHQAKFNVSFCSFLLWIFFFFWISFYYANFCILFPYLMYLGILSNLFSYIFPFAIYYSTVFDNNKTKKIHILYTPDFLIYFLIVLFLWLIILLYYHDNKTKTFFPVLYFKSFMLLYSDQNKRTNWRVKTISNIRKLKHDLVSGLNILQLYLVKKKNILQLYMD